MINPIKWVRDEHYEILRRSFGHYDDVSLLRFNDNIAAEIKKTPSQQFIARRRMIRANKRRSAFMALRSNRRSHVSARS